MVQRGEAQVASIEVVPCKSNQRSTGEPNSSSGLSLLDGALPDEDILKAAMPEVGCKSERVRKRDLLKPQQTIATPPRHPLAGGNLGLQI